MVGKQNKAGKLDKALAFQRKSLYSTTPRNALYLFQVHTVRRAGLPRWHWLQQRKLVCNEDSEVSAHVNQKPGLVCDPQAPCEGM